MAKDSKRKRMKGALKNLEQQAAAARSMLIGVLAQAGGALDVTKGTLQQLAASGSTFDWRVAEKTDDPGTLVITLIENKPAEDDPFRQRTSTSAVTVRKIEDETEAAPTAEPEAAV